MRDLIEYWETRFDWRARERTINAFAHFRATVDGVGIHFIHEKDEDRPRSRSSLLMDGPGSFVEMLRLIPLLTDPAGHGGAPGDAFDVVVPSLPGFGFSDRPTQPGMTNFRIADLWATLMDGLLGLACAGRVLVSTSTSYQGPTCRIWARARVACQTLNSRSSRTLKNGGHRRRVLAHPTHAATNAGWDQLTGNRSRPRVNHGDDSSVALWL
jgi:Epoxide hydrolase N terminus